MKFLLALAGVVAVIFSISPLTDAQTLKSVYSEPNYGAFSEGPDVIDIGTLNLRWEFPLVHQKGRGLDFDYKLIADESGNNWHFVSSSGPGTGYLAYSQLSTACPGSQPPSQSVLGLEVGAFVYVDTTGAPHPFSNQVQVNYNCATFSATGFPAMALDNSGITLICPNCVSGGAYQPVVRLPSGIIVSNQPSSTSDPAPYDPSSNAAAAFTEDNNGNYIYWTGQFDSFGGQTYTDTLGNTVLSTQVTPTNSPDCWWGSGTVVKSYAGGSYTMVFVNCLAQSIKLPDGRSYGFNYGTQGLPPFSPSSTATSLTSVTLPSGGSITYAANTDGTNGFARTVRDAIGHTAIWKYSQPASPTNCAPNCTTTVTDPQGNQTVYVFSVLATQLPQIPTSAPYEISEAFVWSSKTVYSGLASAGHILRSFTQSGYGPRGAGSNTIVSTVYGANNATKTSSTSTYFNATGQVTETDVYDFGSVGGGPGPLIAKTITSYATTLGQIVDHPQIVTSYDGQGNVLASTSYGYDESAVVPTSGTPNHTTPSTSRGNVTSIYKHSGKSLISYHASYFDTGMTQSTSGGSAPATVYAYGQCGNSYPTAVTESVSSTVSLTANTSWNCATGVPASQTDTNGNISYLAFDGFGRSTSLVDPLGNTTSMTYPTPASNVSTVTQTFVGGVPSQYSQTSYDGLGRPILSQTRQGPTGTTYSSVSQIYDLRGPLTWTSTPYTATAGSYVISGAGTTNNIDAARRLVTATDPGGGTTTYSYNLNDVSIATGPAAAGENAKTRSVEYDAAGRLTSVCEITSMVGSGSCGQATAGTGFLTAYTYQGSQVSNIAQNSQAGSSKPQIRKISYDLLGRAISQQMPETGTKTFIYDSDSSGGCPGSYPGSLVKTTDNAGNVQCMTYDSGGRILSAQTVAGIYASLTPQTHYIYDAASLNGTPMQNAMGAVAEQYTCTGACTAKLTDIFNSSYYETSGGQKTGRIVSQTWESTPHSNGYLTSQSISYANGTTAAVGTSLNGTSIGFPAITYGLDSFGRPVTVSDGTNHLSLVTNTAYNSLTNSVTGITFGNSDSEAYGFDLATNRPTSFNYSITGGSPLTIAGGLTWNPNSSLKNFNLTDSSDSTKNQNCNYAMDDLNRLSSVSCAASWAQSFSYDPFGNISKGPIANPGTGQFQQTYAAGYSNASNQAVSGVTAQYDLNGNQTMAETNTMTWNAAGQSVAVNGVVGTYDAAGRVAETGGSLAAVPAAISTGTILVNGNEQSIAGGNDYQATASVTIAGTIKSETINPQVNPHPNGCGAVITTSPTTATCYDAGGGSFQVSVVSLSTGQTFATYAYSFSYSGPTDTYTSLAQALATLINGGNNTSTTGITATSTGGTIALTMKQLYTSQVGFVVSGGSSCNGTIFTPCSFAESSSPSGMIVASQTGVAPTIYDSGTVTAAISNLPVATYAYGSSDTSASIASGLAAAIVKADGGTVTAVATTVNGSPAVQVSSKATGYGINWPIALSTTYNSTSFKTTSFSGTTTNISGGYPAVAGTTGGSLYTQFVYSPAGDKIAVVQNGSLVKGTVSLPGGASAIYSSAGLKYVRHKDWLGSSRLATTWAHGVYSKTAFAPFGESYNQVGTADLSFTGQDQDTASGAYDFQFRKYDPIAGRWMSPDPSGLSYADPTNPQSLNHYSYVRNNPLSNVDPNGLECVWDDGSYDANDDPDSGSSGKCSDLGGTWVDHSYFQTTGMSDWSPNANSNLTCGGITPPSAPIDYSASAQSNAATMNNNPITGSWAWYQAFKGGGTQDFKGNSAYGSPANQTAAGNFNFGASVAAAGMSLATGQFLAGVGAVISNGKSQLNWSMGQAADMQGQYGVPSNTVPQTPPPPSTVGPGFPGFPTMASNGIMTQGDQAAPNENASVVSGFLWQSLGCHQ